MKQHARPIPVLLFSYTLVTKSQSMEITSLMDAVEGAAGTTVELNLASAALAARSLAIAASKAEFPLASPARLAVAAAREG